MLNSRSLFVTALTGFFLFAYVFLRNNQQIVSSSILETIKAIVLVGFSIFIVDVLSFLLINIWFVKARKKQPSDLLKQVVTILLYAPCVFIIFRLLGRDVTALAATSALLTAILGFATGPTLSNLLSGVVLQFDQPFQIGDRIQVQGYEGVVKTIDWRSTGIRLDSCEMIDIPNGSISNNSIKVIAAGNSVYRTIDFTAPATAPPNQVLEVACNAVLNQANPNVNLDKPVFARMWEYGLDNVGYKLFYYPKHYDEAEVHTDPELRCRIWYALSRAGLGNHYTPSENDRVRQLIANVEFFRQLSVEAQRILVERSKTLPFDAEEVLDGQNLPARAMLLVVKGGIAVEQALIRHSGGIAVEQALIPYSGGITVKAFSLRPKTQPDTTLSQKVVVRAAAQLANHLGPAAFSLTYQAAKTASSAYWLYQNLAAEILDFDDREEFLTHQPKAPTEQFRRGDFFGEMSLFLGESLPVVNMITTEETEILAITPVAVAAAVDHDNSSFKALSQQVAQYYNTHLSGTLQAISSRQLSEDTIAAKIQQSFDPYLSKY